MSKLLSISNSTQFNLRIKMLIPANFVFTDCNLFESLETTNAYIFDFIVIDFTNNLQSACKTVDNIIFSKNNFSRLFLFALTAAEVSKAETLSQKYGGTVILFPFSDIKFSKYFLIRK